MEYPEIWRHTLYVVDSKVIFSWKDDLAEKIVFCPQSKENRNDR